MIPQPMTNIAVILAGGTGSRIGSGLPKQLLPLPDGRSILEHSVEAFEQAACIDGIGIVMHPDYIACVEEMLLRNGWQKVAFVIAGGKERWESSVNAIREIEQRTKNKEQRTGMALLQPSYNYPIRNTPRLLRLQIEIFLAVTDAKSVNSKWHDDFLLAYLPNHISNRIKLAKRPCCIYSRCYREYTYSVSNQWCR